MTTSDPVGTAPVGTASGPDTTPMPAYAEIPRIKVTLAREGVAPGYLFLSPQSMLEPEAPHGPQFADDQGRLVWFRPIPEGQYATNVRVQEYRGEPVITWWQGSATNTGVGKGAVYIADRAYRVIATIEAGGEHGVDLHEAILTEEGTAIVVSYQVVPHDLTSIGGAADAMTLDSVIEEVDVETGEVLFHWSGLEHIPLNESNMPAQLRPDLPYDHLHVNAVGIDADGHLVLTARSSSALYKIDRRTGEVIWKLGSGHSTFVLDVGVRCNWQHDGQPVGGDVYRIFDNGANDFFEGFESRVVWVRADTGTGVATHVRQITHPEHLSSIAEGNAQELPGGNVLVGWGRAGRISEFSPDGELLFDAETPSGPGWTTYRVFRQEWEGRPDTPPEVLFDGERVHAVWNGATGVAHWRLLAGPSEDALRPVATVEWDGLDTAIALPEGAPARLVGVEALDAGGEVMGASPARETGA
ncbi:arylsulfotransferase family protein [Actinomadura sp. WMMA1423]|uniref:arylsulfotransferase family protein n=1 Tax=Actinomadura sp. WMMA1423 TaxID=2591108 RepID=UPI001F0E59CC|nr:arylsulfotransferase family protein [Actinomadura sp. WMMA1423]